MFISALELFKIGIGPSSSHTMGPMLAANDFIGRVDEFLSTNSGTQNNQLRCILKGSLAFTGRGHATDKALALGLHGITPEKAAAEDIDKLIQQTSSALSITTGKHNTVLFSADDDIIFDQHESLPEHPNGMVFELLSPSGEILLTEIYFSIGGGFICTHAEINRVVAPLRMEMSPPRSYPFDSAKAMLQMAADSNLSVAEMKRFNELNHLDSTELDHGLDAIWQAMQDCINNGLATSGILPGGLNLPRRASELHQQLTQNPAEANLNDWLCTYAMAVNEENAAGHMVVTAPTNGAAGVIPAVINYLVKHEDGTIEQVRDFLLTAGAIGGLIKHKSSISGAEVGCQGEVGSAASMAAAGLCAAKGGTPPQIENAAEIALEHHLGMTCDPVNGLVQVPCIERNGFGAIKAYTAASLALRGSGQHFMPLDNCIEAMRQTGLEMSHKFKETALGGLAVSITEC